MTATGLLSRNEWVVPAQALMEILCTDTLAYLWLFSAETNKRESWNNQCQPPCWRKEPEHHEDTLITDLEDWLIFALLDQDLKHIMRTNFLEFSIKKENIFESPPFPVSCPNKDTLPRSPSSSNTNKFKRKAKKSLKSTGK